MKPEEYHLKQPTFENLDKSVVIKKLEESRIEFKKFFTKVNEPKYLHWDKIKYKHTPGELSAEESWYLIRQFRSILARETPIKSKNGESFTWIRLPYTEESLHKIDVASGGQIFSSMEIFSESNKKKFISRGIMEESIASSQLEGAHTTRDAAKRMLVENREPKNQSEQMILNNYETMLSLDEDYKHQNLSLELLFEIHKTLTKKTVEPETQNRLRKNSDKIVIQGPIGANEYITHIPPNEHFVKKEIQEIIDFANDKGDTEFLHPVIKAIFLHFWIGYLHPFTDGNGRIARSIFYWYLLKKGYWTFMYLPISTIIKKAPSQYAMAYIYTEQDSNDLTYFYDFNIRKIMQSLNEFDSYIRQKINENKKIDMILEKDKDFGLNDRQKQLIHHLISSEKAFATATSHKTLNNISRQTAAKDLEQLKQKGLANKHRDGKFTKFSASTKLFDMASGKK